MVQRREKRGPNKRIGQEVDKRKRGASARTTADKNFENPDRSQIGIEPRNQTQGYAVGRQGARG